MNLFLAVLIGFLLDWRLAEPRRGHPLVGFGNLAGRLEKKLNRGRFRRFRGVCAWLCVVLPFVLAGLYLSVLIPQPWRIPVAGVVLYLAVGWQSLQQHAQAVIRPLEAGDTEQARYAVSMIVSRDTSEMDAEAVARAATESVLENGADAVFNALFWFVVAGIPGVILYRLANTLDAMWGYRNDRFLQFGWAAARVDDVLNFIPARLTALSYAMVGQTRQALQCWRSQGHKGKSPNAGPVMASGAGAVNARLGGGASYHGQWQEKAPLGPVAPAGVAASAETIRKSVQLMNRTLELWLVVLLLPLVVESLVW